LRTHQLNHLGERNFICEICKETFPRASDLHSHERTHSSIDEQKKKKNKFVNQLQRSVYVYSSLRVLSNREKAGNLVDREKSGILIGGQGKSFKPIFTRFCCEFITSKEIG